MMRKLVTAIVLTGLAWLPLQAEAIPGYFRLPQGSWEEKSGTTLMRILPDNTIQISFIGVFNGTGCEVQVYARLRNEYFARSYQCVQLEYGVLHFTFEKDQLILTLINQGENYREVIFVKEGTVQDAPDI